jgi:hypothetical protein
MKTFQCPIQKMSKISHCISIEKFFQSGHIETIIKNEVAKKRYQRRNMIVLRKHIGRTDFTCFHEHGNNPWAIWNSSMFISV